MRTVRKERHTKFAEQNSMSRYVNLVDLYKLPPDPNNIVTSRKSFPYSRKLSRVVIFFGALSHPL